MFDEFINIFSFLPYIISYTLYVFISFYKIYNNIDMRKLKIKFAHKKILLYFCIKNTCCHIKHIIIQESLYF